MARISTLALLLSALPFAAGCAAGMPTVSLRVKGNAPDAAVTIDDQYLGSLAFVSRRGVAMPPGKHRITVEKPGFFPWDRVVEALDQPVQLDVVLVPIPD